ncbi:MAG: Ribosome maturation factor RimP [Alphaproteobacteria bacterium ADurb.Bin438]|nr:MAG: Ribosome maturation factor RimP [Alphaproteobacteria bacterium ADurb.Bin438]
MAENKNETPLSLEDCTKISRAVSAMLDVEDYIKSNYFLEVSSPGIDRPLLKIADFTRFKGKTAKIELLSPINSQKKFVGIIKEVNEENKEIILEIDSKDLTFNYDDIVKAKLTITDDVFKKEKE